MNGADDRMHADGSCHGSSLVTTVLLFFFFSHSFRGFNEALNGLADDGWSVVGSDGVDDVCVSVSSSPSRVVSCNATFSTGPVVGSSSVLCAKASMLLQVSFAAGLRLTVRICFFFVLLYVHTVGAFRFIYLLGCFSARAPALHAGAAVAVGRQQSGRVLRFCDETGLLQLAYSSSPWRV